LRSRGSRQRDKQRDERAIQADADQAAKPQATGYADDAVIHEAFADGRHRIPPESPEPPEPHRRNYPTA
jgi:hypothetical protein